MKVILTFFLALAATACGGRVVLDDAPTGGQVTGSGGDAGDCDTCYGSLAAGGWPCDGGAGWQAYDGLRQCACSTSSSLCFSACGANFCHAFPVDQACNDCLIAYCQVEVKGCMEDYP